MILQNEKNVIVISISLYKSKIKEGVRNIIDVKNLKILKDNYIYIYMKGLVKKGPIPHLGQKLLNCILWKLISSIILLICQCTTYINFYI